MEEILVSTNVLMTSKRLTDSSTWWTACSESQITESNCSSTISKLHIDDHFDAPSLILVTCVWCRLSRLFSPRCAHQYTRQA